MQIFGFQRQLRVRKSKVLNYLFIRTKYLYLRVSNLLGFQTKYELGNKYWPNHIGLNSKEKLVLSFTSLNEYNNSTYKLITAKIENSCQNLLFTKLKKIHSFISGPYVQSFLHKQKCLDCRKNINQVKLSELPNVPK